MNLARDDFLGTDRFLVQRRLGAGAFGVVYEAYDRDRQLSVALKTIRQPTADALYRFKAEFRALADLAHPNLVALYELLADDERCFFTMELVRGVSFVRYVRVPNPLDDGSAPGTTASMLERSFRDGSTEAATGTAGSTAEPAHVNRALPPASPPPEPYADRLRDALAQLTHGLSALHAAGKLHRDIKPSNVLVTMENRLVLLDFGLVTDLGSLHVDGPTDVRVVGTPAYMSPEQALDRPISQASDWYSVGVMLYEALTGRLPFTGSFPEVVDQKRQSEPPSPRSLIPQIPEDLDALVCDLLRADPAARPASHEVLRRIGRADDRSTTHVVAASEPQASQPFVGRQSHLAALRTAFEQTKAGRSVTVYVHGASGLGKSALVRRFLDRLARDEPEVVILTGRCYEQESVPYKALDQLVDGLSQYLRRLPAAQAEALLPRDFLALSRLFPVLRRVDALASARRRALEIPDPQQLRRRASIALRDLLSRLAERWPVVMFIDDLHWGDVDSASLLTELVRPPDPPPLLLVAGYRSDEATTSPLVRLLQKLRGTAEWGAEVREVIVGELEPDETEALVRALIDPRDRDRWQAAEALGRESGGSPFFIEQLVGHFHTSPESRGSIGLDAVVRARVSTLAEPAARLLNVVALAGRPVSVDVAKQAAGVTPDEYSVLGALRAARLLRTRTTESVEELEAYHDRIRETVLSQLPADVQAVLHERLAVAMEASGRGDPETLAMHFQHGHNNERAAFYAEEAAAQASEALAFVRAARLYRLALELRPPDPGRDRGLRVKLAASLANAGRGADAAEHYFLAAVGAPPAQFVELQRRGAEQLLFSGHVKEGLAAVRTALAAIGMRLAKTPRWALLSLLARRVFVRLRGLTFRERAERELSSEELLRVDSCWSVAVGLAYVETFRAAEFQARHLILALRAGEPYRMARALAMEGGYSSTGGWRTVRRTARIFAAARALAERIGHPHALGLTTVSEGVAASLEGRWQDAVELCERADVILRERCTGVAWELDTVDLTSLVSLIYLGRWQDVSQRLPSLLKDAQERGDLYKSTFLRTRISYVHHLAADEPLRAREEVQKGIDGWSQEGFQLEHYWTLLTKADIAMYEGGAAAWDLIAAAWPALARSLLLRIQYSHIEFLDRRARSAITAASAVPSRDREALLRAAERDARRIERERTPWGDALALAVHGGIAVARGRVDAATAHFTAAEQALGAADMTIHAMSARRRLGELTGGDEGRARVDQADAWMAGERIRNPARIAAMLCPGIWPPEGG